jgi:hypothetical protein
LEKNGIESTTHLPLRNYQTKISMKAKTWKAPAADVGSAETDAASRFCAFRPQIMQRNLSSARLTQSGLYCKLVCMKATPPDTPELQDLKTLQNQMLVPGRKTNQDGSFELGWGIALLCAGGGPYFTAILPKTAWAGWFGYLPLLCMAFAPYAVPKLVKKWITWPRTGYVAYPWEVKLRQLLLLMLFGLAMGTCLGIFSVMFVDGVHGPWIKGKVIWLLIALPVIIYLWPKVIGKRPAIPTAYDPKIFGQTFAHTPEGRKMLRMTKLSLLAVAIGGAIVVGLIVFGLIHLIQSTMHHSEVTWQEWVFRGLLIGANPLLYLMSNAAMIRQQWWKWFLLAAMFLLPLLAAPLIPPPVIAPGLVSAFATAPPIILCLGAVWFVSGFATLIAFVVHNPIPSAPSA